MLIYRITKDEAARILDPETSREALLPYAFDGAYRLALIRQADRMGADALRYLSALNEPLTQGELSAWDGRPAWIVPLGERPWAAQWSIMRHGSFGVKSATRNMVTYCLHKYDCGKEYLAYRRPPEGDETQHA